MQTPGSIYCPDSYAALLHEVQKASFKILNKVRLKWEEKRAIPGRLESGVKALLSREAIPSHLENSR
jgi:hypothetical protein